MLIQADPQKVISRGRRNDANKPPPEDQPRDDVTLGERAFGAAYFGLGGAVLGAFALGALTVADGIRTFGMVDTTPATSFTLAMTMFGGAGAIYGAIKGVEL